MVRLLNNFDDCLKEGLLRRISASEDKALGSLEVAKRWLMEAEQNLNGETFNSTVLFAYIAMFHSARALLIRDGFREKSHFCISRYLEENYVKKKPSRKKMGRTLRPLSRITA